MKTPGWHCGPTTTTPAASCWRVAFVNYFYSQESAAFHRGASIYHDLTAKAYEAGYLVNERGEDWWRINTPLTPAMFSPQAAARGGH